MNKYKVIYYLSIVVFIVNLLAMIGSLFGLQLLKVNTSSGLT